MAQSASPGALRTPAWPAGVFSMAGGHGPVPPCPAGLRVTRSRPPLPWALCDELLLRRGQFCAKLRLCRGQRGSRVDRSWPARRSCTSAVGGGSSGGRTPRRARATRVLPAQRDSFSWSPLERAVPAACMTRGTPPCARRLQTGCPPHTHAHACRWSAAQALRTQGPHRAARPGAPSGPARRDVLEGVTDFRVCCRLGSVPGAWRTGLARRARGPGASGL